MEEKKEMPRLQHSRHIRPITNEMVKHSLNCEEHGIQECEIERLEQYFIQTTKQLANIEAEIERLYRLKSKLEPLIEHVEEIIVNRQTQARIREWKTEDGLHEFHITQKPSVIVENIKLIPDEFIEINEKAVLQKRNRRDIAGIRIEHNKKLVCR